jgi:membrane fusion protein, multidrug efflux system
VRTVAVADNQSVKAGDILVDIDPADAQVRLAAARAGLEKARAGAATAGVDRVRQEAAIAQARAQATGAAADAARAQADFTRYEKLKAEQWASVQRYDAARAQAAQSEAALSAARAGIDTATKQLSVLGAKQQEAVAAVHAAEAELAAAELDLANMVIRAPHDGVIGNRTVRTGQYVRPGTQLLVVVPVREVYVVANYKETQIGAMRAGQQVSLSVDAYPDVTLRGVVESFAPASGSQFALLPPENATGNFTKIVQRIPVKIRLVQPLPRGVSLRPGMSVVSAVDTRSAAPAGATPAPAPQPGRAPALVGGL